MRISLKSKKVAPVHPQVADLINELINASKDDLSSLLGRIDTWSLPRSDLNAWIRVLNKFDEILQDLIRDYDIETLQKVAFSSEDKVLLSEILRFERLLLENSTNRKSFNSYDRINSLLFTSDIDILILTLNLLLRPAQQYSAQQSVAQALNISTSRLQVLAKRWPVVREIDITLGDLTTPRGLSVVSSLPSETREVLFSFYRQDAESTSSAGQATAPVEQSTDILSTPSRKVSNPAEASRSGPVQVRLPSHMLENKSAVEVLAEAVETYSIPNSEHFELLHRIRTTMALQPGHEEDRIRLVNVRLLSIAIFCHTHNEAHANTSLFLYEPDLTTHIAELLQLDRDVPTSVQTSAIAALDALARYKNHASEVLVAVNAGVSHGVLMTLLRHVTADMTKESSALPPSFLDALLSFVTFLASQNSGGGSMLVSAGLVPLLIQLIENRLPNRLTVVAKTMQLVDIILYGFVNAFQLFVTGHGIDALVGRIKSEVDTNIEQGGDQGRPRDVSLPYGHLSVARASVLKHSLRSIHRMMQSSGTAEGLRGLIDSSLLSSVKKIIEHRVLFGPNILSMAINIMATFVHNEPTCLTIIQEAGLPQVFYTAIEVGLEPLVEVIQAVPNALGALCLNETGLQQLASRPSTIPAFFSIFTSERHLKILADKENAVMTGTIIDELVRHHPSLKAQVMASIRSTMSKIEQLCDFFEAPEDQKHWYYLVPSGSSTTVVSTGEDVAMANGEPAATSTAIELMDMTVGDDDKIEENTPPQRSNSIVAFIDILNRFLEGFFQHHLHCQDFITDTGGLDFLGRITAMRVLPYDYGNSVYSDSLVQVIRTLAEANPEETLAKLSNLVQDSLAETTEFWQVWGGSSKLATFLEFSDAAQDENNVKYRKLITLQTRVTLLSEVYSTAGHTSGRTAHAILKALMGPSAAKIMPDLGSLHRSCIWENIVLKKHIEEDPSSDVGGEEEQAAAATGHAQNAAGEGVDRPMSETLTNPAPPNAEFINTPAAGQSELQSPRKQNAQALKHVVTQIPAALAPLFQATVRLFTTSPRRTLDASHKSLILDSGSVIVDVLLQHISQTSDDQRALFAYQTIVLGLFSILLVEEHNDKQEIHTVVLSAMYNNGGIAALLAIGQHFISTIERLGSIGEGDRDALAKEQLVCSYAGLKVLLHLLQPLVSSTVIFASTQTILLSSNEKKEGDNDYFSASNLLVRLRSAVLPLARQMWESDWLLEAPEGLIKSLAQIVLELVKAENEEKSDAPAVPVIASTTFRVDETRIAQITDMGFSRGSARRALTRARNNVAAATELLISQPYLFPSDADAAEPNDVNMEAEHDSEAENDATENPPPQLPEKTIEEWVGELKALRQPLQDNAGQNALRIVDAHPTLIFEIQALFIGSIGSHQEANIRRLVADIKAFSPGAYDEQEQPLAVRCRLLALALSHPGCQDVLRNDGKTIMECLLALLLSKPVQSDTEGASQPKWLAAHLLVAEALLMMGEQPRAISIPGEGEPIEPEQLFDASLYPEGRHILFEKCMQLAAVPSLPSTDLLSCLRILILLTREHKYAVEFIKQDGVSMLLACLRQGERDNEIAIKSHVIIIFRHVVEDPDTIQSIVRQAFKRFFTNPKTRGSDVSNFVRGCASVALRDPLAFVNATSAVCTLSTPFGSPQSVQLKDDAGNAAKGVQQDVPQSPLLDSPAKSNDILEPLVHLLVKELIASSKVLFESTTTSDGSNAHASVGETGETSVVDSSSTPSETDSKATLAYTTYLLQALTELLFSYDACKVAFLSYPGTKRTQTPSKEKARSTALHHLLSDLIQAIPLDPSSNEASKPQSVVCNWAMSVIVALCVDPSNVQDMKDLSSDVVSVRKVVLESIGRAMKDVASMSNITTRYGRLMVLSDLIHRLLVVRPHITTKKPIDDTPTHLSKLMLEKNYVSIMTNSLSEVDLNYPNVKNLVTAILKPLELLSRIAIKMNRSTDETKEALPGPVDDAASSSEDEVEEENEGDGPREETPDLYRNSSLGMFSGEMEDVHFTPQDDIEDEEMEGDDDDDVEMEFGDETGSEDTSRTDDEEEQLDAATMQNTWEDEEEVDADDQDEDAVHIQDDDEDDDDDDDDDDDGGQDEDEDHDQDGDQEEEVAWQVDAAIDGEVDDDINGDDEEDAAGGVGVIIPGPEAEVLSDDEGLVATIRDAEVVEGFGDDDGFEVVGDVPNPTSMFDALFAQVGGGPQVIRRSLAGVGELEALGHARQSGPSAPDVVIHPLLYDNGQQVTSATTSLSRSRRTQRNDTLQNISHEVMHSLQDTLGPGAIQVFRAMVNRHGVPTIRHIEVTGNLPQIGRSSRHSRSDQRIERGFEPLLTSYRWTEEAKILYGHSALERLIRLQNHVTLAMLPSAISTSEERKRKEAEATRLKEEEDKEAQRKKEEEKEIAQQPSAEIAAAAPHDHDQSVDDATSASATESSAALESAGPPVPDSPMPADDMITELVEEAGATTNTDADVPMQDDSPDVTPEREPAEADAEVVTAEVGTSEPQARVMITIHGNPVDITDTGIDPTFLEALPDDMREEIVNQHIRDQRLARVERPEESQISAEFLDALPPEIRAEIIQQENMERAARAVPPPAAAEGAGPADIDPASFIASLDPQLRQVVMMEQDDGFIRSLPSHMVAEANMYREVRPPRSHPREPPPHPPPPRKAPVIRDAIQLVDKSAVSTLVRLLFFPQVLRKSLLLKTLLNLCENSKTRTEILTLLTNILHEGTGDVTAIDKSFSQLSFRNAKPSSPLNPKVTGKQRALPESDIVALPSQEAVPELIAQRCLEALSFVVSSNEHSAVFFLTQHELSSSMKRSLLKKGKGKEKPTPTHYPIVSLLGLLDRKTFLKTPSIMEGVVHLLATVTRPLTSLPTATVEKEEETKEEPPQGTEPATGEATSSTQATAEGSTQAAAEGSSHAEEAQPDVTQDKPKGPLSAPPQIPSAILRLVVNILTVGECSGRAFQHTLALIQHLSFIPDSREVVAQELSEKAQESEKIIQADLQDLARVLRDHEPEVLVNPAISKFSLASSEQAKLLRILKTIDYMYSNKTTETIADKDVDQVQSIYESFQFAPLWSGLGNCLKIIEDQPDLELVATVLLPLIESLMVVCKHVGSASAPATRANLASSSPRAPTTPRESMQDLFVTFTDDHRKILNLMVRNNPSLMSGSFSLLVNNPRVLDFDNKRNYFNQQLKRRAPNTREHHSTLQLRVRRARVFEDSFQQLQRKTGEQIKNGKLSVRFFDEEGVDAGGLTREWFQILARQMFNPNYALFQPCVADKLTYQPNQASAVNPEHLSFFKFVGRVIGKAIYDSRLLDAYFARSFYRQLLGKPVDYRDVEWVDPEYYNSLCWILENDPEVLDMNFTVEADEFGVMKVIPLKENGANITVTNENKREFVQLSAQHRLYNSIKDQIEALLSGFYDIIPKELISIFNEQEVELLISGTPDVDVDEWRAATDYHGFTTADPAIVWWWRALKSFNREERAKVLSFATGTSRVPLGGFTDLQGVQGVQKFSIHRAYGARDRLPQAHTCFNQIDLPEYTSYEKLRQQLLVAINEGGEGFGFA